MLRTTEAIDTTKDAEYLAAVAAGDTEKCQKMVDDAAKAAGYTTGPVYHGTSAKFTRFDTAKLFHGTFGVGVYLSNSASLGKQYSNGKAPMVCYVALHNPYLVRYGRPTSQERDARAIFKLPNSSTLLSDKGFDGVEVQQDSDPYKEYVIFDPSHIKSADPVTYDDQGKVIPLSQRFDSSKDDIRESVENSSTSRVSIVKKSEEALKPPMPPKIAMEATFTVDADPEQVKLFRRWVEQQARRSSYRPDYPNRQEYEWALDYPAPAGTGKFRVSWYVPQDNPHPNVEEVLAFLQLMWEDFQQLPPPPEKKPRTTPVRDEEGRALPPTTPPNLDKKVMDMLITDLEPYWQAWGKDSVEFWVSEWEKYLEWANAHDRRSPREYAKEITHTDNLSQWGSVYAPVEQVRPKFEHDAQYNIEWSRYKFLTGVAKHLPLLPTEVKEITRTSVDNHAGAVEGVWDILYEDGSRKRLTTRLIWAGGYNIQREHTRYLVRVTDITPVLESQESQPTQEMLNWFEERTRRHIALAQKYGKMVAEAFPEYASLPEEMEDHDASKFKTPEYIPYVFMTWQRKHPKFTLPASVDITKTTLHHVVNNTHHPEFWSPNAAINPKDRDADPAEIVDAKRMPEIAIAEMCADWAAMGEEMGNSPLDWAEKKINKRWLFTPEQEALIYTILEAIWTPEGDPELQEEGWFSKKPVVYTGDIKTPKVNPKRFTAPAHKLSPQNEFGGLYGVLSMSLPWGEKKKTEIWDIIYQRVRDRYWTTAFQGKRNKQGDFRELIRDFLDSQYGASIGGDLLAAARFSEFMLYQTAQECSMRSWDAYWRNYLRYREWD